MGVQQQTKSEARKNVPMESVMDQLRRNIEELKDELEILESRLTPILSSDPGIQGQKIDIEAVCPFHGFLLDLNSLIISIRSHLSSIHDRITL